MAKTKKTKTTKAKKNSTKKETAKKVKVKTTKQPRKTTTSKKKVESETKNTKPKKKVAQQKKKVVTKTQSKKEPSKSTQKRVSKKKTKITASTKDIKSKEPVISERRPEITQSPIFQVIDTPQTKRTNQGSIDQKLIDKWLEGSSHWIVKALDLLQTAHRMKLPDYVPVLTKKEEKEVFAMVHEANIKTPEGLIDFVLEDITRFKHKSIASSLVRYTEFVEILVHASTVDIMLEPDSMYKYATKSTGLGFYWDVSTLRFEYIASYARKKSILPCVVLFSLMGGKMHRKLNIGIYL